mgnify:CR=1 FL=1
MKKVISTQNAPAAIGPYSQAIEVNGMVYTSGVIPVNPATGEIPDGAEAQTRQAMTSLSNLLEAAGTSMDNGTHRAIIKLNKHGLSSSFHICRKLFRMDALLFTKLITILGIGCIVYV